MSLSRNASTCKYAFFARMQRIRDAGCSYMFA